MRWPLPRCRLSAEQQWSRSGHLTDKDRERWLLERLAAEGKATRAREEAREEAGGVPGLRARMLEVMGTHSYSTSLIDEVV